jgi:Rubisco LSMT substrate-binding
MTVLRSALAAVALSCCFIAAGAAAQESTPEGAAVAAFFAARCPTVDDGAEAALAYDLLPADQMRSGALGRVRAVAQRDLKRGETLCTVDLNGGGGLTIEMALAEPVFGPVAEKIRLTSEELRRRAVEEYKQMEGDGDEEEEGAESADEADAAFVHDEQLMKLFLIWLRQQRATQRATGTAPAEGSVLSAEGGDWATYVDILPVSFDTPLFWNGRELRQLKGSALYRSVRSALETLEADFEDLFPALHEKHPEMFPAEVFNKDSFQWAHGVFSSRHWFRSSNKIFGGAFPVFPFIDAYNPERNVTVKATVRLETVKEGELPGSENFVDFIVSDDVAMGSEVALGDEPMGNRDLLEFFGFVIPNNPADAIELSVGMNPEDQMYGNKKRMLEAAGLRDQQMYFLRDNEVPTDLINALRVYHSSVYDWDQAERILDNKAISAQSEMKTTNDIVNLVKSNLKKYPTSAKEDKALLARIRKLLKKDAAALSAETTKLKKKDPLLGADHASLRRTEAAVLLRRGEKKILVHALGIAHEAARRVQNNWEMREMDIPGTDEMRTTVLDTPPPADGSE